MHLAATAESRTEKAGHAALAMECTSRIFCSLMSLPPLPLLFSSSSSSAVAADAGLHKTQREISDRPNFSILRFHLKVVRGLRLSMGGEFFLFF